MRVPPHWLSDAVELWARARGQHAKAFWHRAFGCWGVEIEARRDHPGWAQYYAGEAAKPHEVVFLADPGTGAGMVPFDLEELGAAGVTELLEQASVLTGRGEHETLFAALRAVREQHKRLRDERRAALDEVASETAWLHAGRLSGRPFVTVNEEIH